MTMGHLRHLLLADEVAVVAGRQQPPSEVERPAVGAGSERAPTRLRTSIRVRSSRREDTRRTDLFADLAPRPPATQRQCVCGDEAVERTVVKDGPNKGRKFFSCSKPAGDSQNCHFFVSIPARIFCDDSLTLWLGMGRRVATSRTCRDIWQSSAATSNDIVHGSTSCAGSRGTTMSRRLGSRTSRGLERRPESRSCILVLSKFSSGAMWLFRSESHSIRVGLWLTSKPVGGRGARCRKHGAGRALECGKDGRCRCTDRK